MQRNDKGQFVSEAVTPSIEEQILAAEEELKRLRATKAEKEEEAKRTAALARKAEADLVNNAIDKYEAAKEVCNEKIRVAYEEYQKNVNEAEKELKTVEADADEKLNEFLKTHDSFHYSYKSKDGKISREYNYRKNTYDVFDNYNRFVKAINDLWFK